MNRDVVANILDVLKTSTDKNVILKGLVKLRTDVVKDREGIVLFHECHGIPPMVRFLNKPHEQILEVVLSILGNCCTNSDCCKEALGNKITVPLATILKSIPNALIQCRACRLLGNLAKTNNAKSLSINCPVIASAVCQIIEETSDAETRTMCFRACRFLLSDEHFERHFLASNGFASIMKTLVAIMKKPEIKEPLPVVDVPPKAGGSKKNQHREKYFEEVARHLEGARSDIFDKEILKNSKTCTDYVMPTDKAIVNVASEILKCLLIISKMDLTFQAWEMVNRTKSFAAVVFFATDDNPYRATALKILSNFSMSTGAVNALSSANAIVAACELLVCRNIEKDLTESEMRDCITVIWRLSEDACNRSKIRRSGAIARLLDIARVSKTQSDISSILYVLNNFQYDSISMDLMLREGLVSLLINELNSFLRSRDEQKKKREEKNSSKKRKLSDAAIESSSKAQKLRDESVYDYDSPCSSPRSVISPSSPCSSRSMSPVCSGFKITSEMDSDSDTYSPVCSDDEGADDDDNKKTDNHDSDSDIMKLLDIACKTETGVEDNVLDKEEEDDDDDSHDVDSDLSNLAYPVGRGVHIIENLLLRVTLLVNKCSELCKPETLNTLIAAIRIFGINTGFSGSLTNILSESQFFAQIIKLGVVHQLFQMTKVIELEFGGHGYLETLSNVGQSNYGKGELSGLLRLDGNSQKKASIAVAFLIRRRRILYPLLTEFNALHTLVSLILNNDKEFAGEAVDALTALSETLDITMPEINKISFACDDIFVESASSTKDCDMKFIVHNNDEEISVSYNKKLLSDASEVFETMLKSDFREGKEGEIHLKNYSASGLRYFLNLIERISLKKLPNIPPGEQYTSLIEAFELSRVYIIPQLEEVLFNIMVHLLDETNCQSVFEWSMKNYHTELTEIAINYYLCSNISAEKKVELFQKADVSMYSNEWNQMITDAVLVRSKDKAYYTDSMMQ